MSQLISETVREEAAQAQAAIVATGGLHKVMGHDLNHTHQMSNVFLHELSKSIFKMSDIALDLKAALMTSLALCLKPSGETLEAQKEAKKQLFKTIWSHVPEDVKKKFSKGKAALEDVFRRKDAGSLKTMLNGLTRLQAVCVLIFVAFQIFVKDNHLYHSEELVVCIIRDVKHRFGSDREAFFEELEGGEPVPTKPRVEEKALSVIQHIRSLGKPKADLEKNLTRWEKELNSGSESEAVKSAIVSSINTTARRIADQFSDTVLLAKIQDMQALIAHDL